MYSLLLLLLPPLWLRMIFFPFLSRQFPANANRTRIPFFCIFVNDVSIACTARTFQFGFVIRKKQKQLIQWDFFAFLLATEKKKMNKKTSFFFTVPAHTCLCNDVSNSNTMEIYFFLLSLCVLFEPTLAQRRRLNRTLLLRNPIRLTRDSSIRIAVVSNGI